MKGESHGGRAETKKLLVLLVMLSYGETQGRQGKEKSAFG